MLPTSEERNHADHDEQGASRLAVLVPVDEPQQLRADRRDARGDRQRRQHEQPQRAAKPERIALGGVRPAQGGERGDQHLESRSGTAAIAATVANAIEYSAICTSVE